MLAGAVEHYGSGESAVVVLDDVTIAFPAGEFTAVMGRVRHPSLDRTTLRSTATPAQRELKRIANPGGYLRTTVVNLYVHCTTRRRSAYRHEIE
ncbi:hypothetical protein GCM10023224_26950 [Streptomonospora halophila]|uniref:Uncharacterized protein n=1 Tax=Streptomonospora halophila TaxID=427369 RepID=A0ABP9GGQ5_9ACTN